MRALAPIAGIAALATLAGCGASPPTTILTLDAVAPTATEGRYRGPPIAVPAVAVPAAIDRTSFVRQVAAGQLKIDDFAQWAAPLGLLARDALVRDLTARLPAGKVLPPGSGGGPGARTLGITILSLDAAGATATMQVSWRTLPGGPVHLASLQSPLAAATPTATAQAFAALIGQLSDAIAADLAGAG